MDILTRYTVEFRYLDNDELYSNDILVAPDKLKRVKNFFGRLLDEGRIEAADGTDSDEIDNVVFQRTDNPQSFEQLRQSIEDGYALKSYGEALGIEI